MNKNEALKAAEANMAQKIYHTIKGYENVIIHRGSMKILDLPLKSKWYLMIEKGIKKEEYREIKPCWIQRLYQYKKEYQPNCCITKGVAEVTCHQLRRDRLIQGLEDMELRPYTHVRFRYGYTKKTMLFEIKEICIDYGKPEWGAPDEVVFVIKLGGRIE